MIDTLAYVKRLEGAGISRVEAEAHATAIKDTVVPQLATKSDLESLKVTLILAVIAINGFFSGILFGLIKLT